jgi:hypothetical protein
LYINFCLAFYFWSYSTRKITENIGVNTVVASAFMIILLHIIDWKLFMGKILFPNISPIHRLTPSMEMIEISIDINY